MTVTFPHLGNAFICVKVLLERLGIEYVIPPFNSRKTLELGARHVPESACLPLKVTVGNLIEAYEQGADTILMVGGSGPCRFGYYCEMQREIMDDIGLNMDLVSLEVPRDNPLELLTGIKRLTGRIRPLRLLLALRETMQIAAEVDRIEKYCRMLRPMEKKAGIVDSIYNGFREKALSTPGRQINKIIGKTMEKLSSLETDNQIRPLKVGIVGEIFTTIDQSANFGLEQKLGHMGVSVDRKISVSGWIYNTLIKKAFMLPVERECSKAAKPYLGMSIGGHAIESVGNTVLYAREDYDGVIQIYPLTCMPEIVAQSILPSVEKDYDIPVLTLVTDEMTGEAGFNTRIEAFVDLLMQNAKAKAGKAGSFAYGTALYGD